MTAVKKINFCLFISLFHCFILDYIFVIFFNLSHTYFVTYLLVILFYFNIKIRLKDHIILYLFIFSILCLFFYYFIIQEEKSYISLFSNIVAIFFFLYLSAAISDKYDFYINIKILIKYIVLILFIQLVLSSIFTSIKLHGHEDYYFYESFFTEKRFKFFSGSATGHSLVGYMLPIFSIYLFVNLLYFKKNYLLNFIIVFFLILLAYYTKSRIVFLSCLIIICISYLFFKFNFVKKNYLLIISCLLFLNIFFLFFDIDWLSNIIFIFSNREIDYYNISSSRKLLNVIFFEIGLNNFFVGISSSHDIFTYGLDVDGYVSYSTKKITGSESFLLYFAKFGFFYFISFSLFLLSMIFNVNFKNNYEKLMYCNLIFYTLMVIINNGIYLNNSVLAFLLFFLYSHKIKNKRFLKKYA